MLSPLKLHSAALLCCLAAVAHGQCTTSATLPAAGSNLACWSGTTGGGSTAANAPVLGPSVSGADYCAAYSIQCSPSDQGAACAGQPAGTVIRSWVPLGAATAQQILTMPTIYMQPYVCSTSGCNTVAASATCTGGGSVGSISTLTSCGGSTCNVPPTAGTGCSAVNTAPIPLDGTCTSVAGGFFLKAMPGTVTNTANLQWFLSTACSGTIAGTNTNLPLGGSASNGCQAAPFGSVYAAGSSKGSSATSSSVAWVALAAAAAAALALARQ